MIDDEGWYLCGGPGQCVGILLHKIRGECIPGFILRFHIGVSTGFDGFDL